MLRRKKLVVASLMVVAIVAASFGGCKGSRKTETSKKELAESPRLLVKAVQVKPHYLAKRLRYYGVVSGSREAIIYPEAMGKIEKILVSEGDYVKKDQVIALVDRSIPGLDYPPLKVKSPISGIVSFIYVKPGQSVAPQVPIASVVDTSTLEIRADAPQSDLPKLKPGLPVLIYWESDTFRAKLKSVSPAVDPIRKTGEIKVKLRKAPFKPGMLVKFDVVLEETQNALAVPLSAIVSEDGTHFVFVVENGVAHKRQVELGLEDDDLVEVKSGLNEGELVVVEGASGLSDGQPVEVTKW